MSRRSSFDSRQRARAVSSHIPVITADVDAARIYEQRWRRRDGRAVRVFSVLALDDQMADEMGGIRLREKHDESILDWTLVSSRPLERSLSVIFAILTMEDPDEAQLRQEAYRSRTLSNGAPA